MAGLEHERERLYRAVDKFIELNDTDDYPDLRIDTFGIVAIGFWNANEDGEAEAPFQWFESRRRHAQIGLLRTCLLEQEGSYVTSVELDSDEEGGEQD